jgi:hypothetical protein
MHRVAFSGRNVDIADFALHHNDLADAMRTYFTPDAQPQRFATYTPAEVIEEYNERARETDLASAMTILGAVEAAFRIDYLQRCYLRPNDDLSRACRDLHKRKRNHAKLEDDLFLLWLRNTNGDRAVANIIRELRGAFKYRHWLAHGRYWTPKSGAKTYDYITVYALAANVMTNFPLIGV